jgi:hypothetical protein
VKNAFDDAGIVMPEPAYRVLMHSGQVADELGVPGASQAGKVAGGNANETESVQDTSADKSVERTLEEEIQSTDDENLLKSSAEHE